MYVYIDGSGKDLRRERQVLVALCVPQEANRHLPGFLFELKKEVYGVEKAFEVDPDRAMEIKAERLLDKSIYTKALEGSKEELLKYVILVERIFEGFAANKEFEEVSIFSIVMPYLDFIPFYPEGLLPNPLRFLLQRVNKLIDQKYSLSERATIILDRNNEIIGNDRDLLFRFINHCYSNVDNLQYIDPAPIFADSRLTPGLELADLIAGCLRLCWEENLVPHYLRPEWDRVPERSLEEVLQDPFLSRLNHYLDIILSKVRHLEKYYGIYAPRPEAFKIGPKAVEE